MAALLGQLDAVAQSPVSVILLGEPGTGRALLARHLHHIGTATHGSFSGLRCPTDPDAAQLPALLDAPAGGTLFLGGVDELSPDGQARLLGALAGRTSGARVVCSTTQDLRSLCERGAFREDLYYRLKVVELQVPPLRARRGDVSLLIEHFAALWGFPTLDLTPAARARLLHWHWPGNVRELRHAIQHALLMARGGTIDLPHLPADLRGPPPRPAAHSGSLADAMARFERRHLVAALRDHAGNRTRTARALGISRKNLWEKMKSHEITDGELSSASGAESSQG